MDSANTTLEGAGSAIKLVKGGADSWPQDNGNDLIRVAPTIRDLKWRFADTKNTEKLKAANRKGRRQKADSEGVKDSTLALWTDCGRASRVVTGGMVAAIYTKGSIKYESRKSTDPAVFSNTMYSKVIVPFMESDEADQYMKEGVHYKVDPDNSAHWLLLAPVNSDQARRRWSHAWVQISPMRGRASSDDLSGVRS